MEINMKKIIVTCDRGQEKAEGIAEKIRDEFANRNLEVEVIAVEDTDVEANLEGASAYITTIARVPDYGIPIFSALPFVTGFAKDKQMNNIIKALSLLPLA